MKIAISKSIFLITLIVITVLSTACDPNALNVQREEEESTYRRAERFKREGRQEEALKSYLKVITHRTRAPESHLNAGLLYLQHRRDPISAIYHFNRYLELEPESDKAKLVRQQIEAAKRLFISNLPGQPYQNEYERLDLIEQIKRLEAENQSLQEQLLVTRQQFLNDSTDSFALENKASTITPLQKTDSQSTAPPLPKDSQTTAQPSPFPTKVSSQTTPEPEQTRSVESTYVVQKGDTLFSISKQIYNTPKRWTDIYRANQDTLGSPDQLKVGQKLRLP